MMIAPLRQIVVHYVAYVPKADISALSDLRQVVGDEHVLKATADSPYNRDCSRRRGVEGRANMVLLPAARGRSPRCPRGATTTTYRSSRAGRNGCDDRAIQELPVTTVPPASSTAD
jgi:hypothetical protein